MSNIVNPVRPYCIKSNQYGAFPGKTYYYIADSNGATFHHKDQKWRKKSTIEMTYWYYTLVTVAESHLRTINENSMTKGDKVLINDDLLTNEPGIIERVGANEKWPYYVKYAINCGSWFSEKELTFIANEQIRT